VLDATQKYNHTKPGDKIKMDNQLVSAGGTRKYNDQMQRTAETDCKDCATEKYNDQLEHFMKPIESSKIKIWK